MNRVMNLDYFFGTPKWRILELLAEKPLSPSELSVNLQTSIAYVSQQLKLLEATGFIIKKKTGMSQKGKPRSVYSLSKETLSLAVLTKGWSSKKFLELTTHHKIILRIWMIDNSSLHYHIEKFYWNTQEYLSEIKAILFSNEVGNELIIISDSKNLKNKLSNLVKKEELKVSIVTLNEFLKRNSQSVFSIYDPSRILNKGVETYD